MGSMGGTSPRRWAGPVDFRLRRQPVLDLMTGPEATLFSNEVGRLSHLAPVINSTGFCLRLSTLRDSRVLAGLDPIGVCRCHSPRPRPTRRFLLNLHLCVSPAVCRSRGRRNTPPASTDAHCTSIETVFGTAACIFGILTRRTPSLVSARMPFASMFSGSEKLREKVP